MPSQAHLQLDRLQDRTCNRLGSLIRLLSPAGAVLIDSMMSLVAVSESDRCAFLFDADTRHLVTVPNLHKPKRHSISLFIPKTVHGDGNDGGSLFITERIPRPEARSRTQTNDQFEAFIYRKPAVTSFAESCLYQLLPPPYLLDYNYCQRSHKITAYGVVDGGSQICISVEDVSTYCLDAASHTWSQVGK
ncbi:hypothetical protein E2562_024624 [Oryza meyeriana var. granulata]|uniref:Uncharacterized protein n=1 Tax=Oryza meyeriana var. granulata TaxID=110450 RepID=A0A6G1DMN4_9ORYZ|nr:hypothetical protein E2562_024624 [Oryza meyeriana var. granulata]